MFGIVSGIRSLLGRGGSSDTTEDEWDDFTYETEDDTEATDEEVEVATESEEADWSHDEIDPVIEAAPEEVQEIESVQDIKGLGETRASRLDRLGINTPSDVYFADDEALTEAHGVGEYTVEQIRDDIGSP